MKKHTLTLQTQPKLCPLPCEDCTATVEIGSDHLLHTLAQLLISSIGFDFDHAFGFFDNLSNPYKSTKSYTIFADMGDGDSIDAGELPVSGATVGQVFSKGTKMAFLFDYGDGWHFLITCKKVEEKQGDAGEPKVVSIEGKPPIQYPNFDE